MAGRVYPPSPCQRGRAFWPLLRGLFPDAVATLDELTREHKQLNARLNALGAAIAQIETAALSAGRSSVE